jgi:transposase
MVAGRAGPLQHEEDARPPNREREKLVGDRARVINRIKATLIRFGIRTFTPILRKAEERLKELHTAEDTLAELLRDIARLRLIQEQIKEIEQRRLRDLKASSAKPDPHPMVA